MEIALWVILFVVSLVVMVRGADYFLKNAELVGIHFGMPAFVIGVLIVGIGTSLPELVSAVVSVLKGVPEIVAANAIGSNIANILLIGGVLAVIGRRLVIEKDLLDAELPFFVISTVLFVEVVIDGSISVVESVLLTAAYAVYLYYLFNAKESEDTMVQEVAQEVRREKWIHRLPSTSVLAWMLVGLAALLVGAKFLIDAVVALAAIAGVSPTFISITAVALGTSLPELVVSIQALRDNKIAVAVGNIFGSNAFNILMAVGIPGLFGVLTLDSLTFEVGLPIFVVSSFIFLIVGLARKLYRWEGLLFLVLYLFFLIKVAEFVVV